LKKSQDANDPAPGKPGRKPPKPTPKPAADRPSELIDAAIRLFSVHPYSLVSIDEIGAEAGVAKGLLYYHFGSKQGLYVAALQRLATEMHAELAAAAADESAEPIERLMLALDAHLAFIERYPAGYRELLSGAATHPEIEAIMEGERAVIREMLLEGLPPEVPRGAAIELALKGWMSFVDGVELAWLTDGGLDRVQVRELCSRVLVGAVLAAIEVENKTAQDAANTTMDANRSASKRQSKDAS
jgi:AcrR family transcriptional regulator